jgi:integrase
MNPELVKRFNSLYQRHLRLLTLQGKSQKTIDAYSQAIRRIRDYFDCCPDQLTREQLETYFAKLVETHSWSTVKIDRNGLQFFWRYVLKRGWDWIKIIKPPNIQTIPDILTPSEIERIIGKTRKLRYRVFLLTTYSLGLRLEETLSLHVGDIDAGRKRVHVRRGKGHKDRLIPLPDLTLQGLRELWRKHRHPYFLFLNASGSLKTIQQTTTHMDRGGAQNAMKRVVAECGLKKSIGSFPSTQLRHASFITRPEPAA